MSYGAAIDYLYSLQKHGIKLGLEKTAAILSLVGDPHRKFRCIHIAGTNGKGSVSAMAASILKAHGCRVGLFTSPHLVSFTERIRIGDEEISESEVASLTDEVRSRIDSSASDLNPTFFEVVTAVAFLYFARKKIEWAVIETGMGGRLDATNLVSPEVTIITRISSDHREFLGDGIAQIAGEKAGIIKKGVPVVSAPQSAEAMTVIAAAAKENSAPMYICGNDFAGRLRTTGMGGTRFDYSDGDAVIEDLFTPLPGEYQVMNAALAIKAVSIALERTEGYSPEARKIGSAEIVKKGLAATRWRGRLELVSNNPPIIIDGAHNAEAAAALAGFLAKYLAGRKIILLLGIMADKEIKDILTALLPVAAETILTAPAYNRAESPDRLAEFAQSAGFKNIHVAPNVRDAIIQAREYHSSYFADDSPVIVITGSFYTAGEAMELLGERPVLGTLREAL